MKILVTGVKGQLGFDIVRQLKKLNYQEIRGIDKDDLDITNQQDVEEFFLIYQPDIIIHNAAYTAVDLAEEQPQQCHMVNMGGTANLVNIAKKYQSKFIYISTDYIFDGTKEGFYEINDAPNPVSVYGKTKLEGENIVRTNLDKFFIIRISWVFGINGKNFIKTMLNLAESRKEVSVVSDQFGSPTYTYDLSKLICEMMITERFGIYHATNEGVCSWYELAKVVFEIANIDMIVHPILTKDYPTKAKRPMNSMMSKKSLTENGFSLLPDWKDAVERYLKEVKDYA